MHHHEMTSELQKLFETLNCFVADLERGKYGPTNSVRGQGYERDIELCACHMIDRIAKLEEIYVEDNADEEREARLAGGHNYMSMHQLGVSPR